jgi:hypothetical protein
MINGKSGCNLEIINKDFDFFLKKFSKNIDGNVRLVIQANKQIEFYKQNEHPFIKSPEITSVYVGTPTELAYIEMRYIIGKNIIAFLGESDISVINRFIENILSYLDHIFKNVKSGKIDAVAKKTEQIDFLDFPQKERIMRILKRLPEEELPQGLCHGDFTMANMVLTNSMIYAVDFLNTYIDSPILDLLSIRQDTRHLWSCLLSQTYPCRVVETLKYIDKIISERYDWVIENEWYRYLSLMNYVRMYPFNTEKHTTEFINNCILEYL